MPVLFSQELVFDLPCLPLPHHCKKKVIIMFVLSLPHCTVPCFAFPLFSTSTSKAIATLTHFKFLHACKPGEKFDFEINSKLLAPLKVIAMKHVNYVNYYVLIQLYHRLQTIYMDYLG